VHANSLRRTDDVRKTLTELSDEKKSTPLRRTNNVRNTLTELSDKKKSTPEQLGQGEE
jgi:hypothetical protein